MTCTGSTTRVVSSSLEPDRYSISTDLPRLRRLHARPPRSPASTSSPTASRGPSAASSFASARRRASSSEPGHSQQQPGRRRHGEPLRRRQRPGPPELLRQESPHGRVRHLDLHQRVRRIRRRPAARRQLQLGHELLLAHAELLRHLGDRRLAHLRQPPDHGQQPSQPPARLRARRSTGPVRRPGSALVRRGGHHLSRRTFAISAAGVTPAVAVGQCREPLDELVAERGGLEDGDVVGEAEHPRADGGERVHGEHELDRAVVEPPHDLVLTDLVGDAPGFDGVDLDAHLGAVVAVGVPGLVGQRRLDVDVVGDTVGGLAPRDLPLDPVNPERAHGVAVEVPRNEVPVAETEPQAERRHAAVASRAVGERRRRFRAHGLEELDQRRRRDDAGDRADVAEAGRTQLQQRIPPTRIGEVDAGDGEG